MVYFIVGAAALLALLSLLGVPKEGKLLAVAILLLCCAVAAGRLL